MKVKMLAYHDGHSPGEILDFDDEEAERQIEIGGARALTEAEAAAEAEREASKKGKTKPATPAAAPGASSAAGAAQT